MLLVSLAAKVYFTFTVTVQNMHLTSSMHNVLVSMALTAVTINASGLSSTVCRNQIKESIINKLAKPWRDRSAQIVVVQDELPLFAQMENVEIESFEASIESSATYFNFVSSPIWDGMGPSNWLVSSCIDSSLNRLPIKVGIDPLKLFFAKFNSLILTACIANGYENSSWHCCQGISILNNYLSDPSYHRLALGLRLSVWRGTEHG